MTKQQLTAQAIDAGTFETSRYETRSTAYLRIPVADDTYYGQRFEVEKGGWITLLWDTYGARQGDAAGGVTTEARTIQVSRERAMQAFRALSAGKLIV